MVVQLFTLHACWLSGRGVVHLLSATTAPSLRMHATTLDCVPPPHGTEHAPYDPAIHVNVTSEPPGFDGSSLGSVPAGSSWPPPPSSSPPPPSMQPDDTQPTAIALISAPVLMPGVEAARVPTRARRVWRVRGHARGAQLHRHPSNALRTTVLHGATSSSNSRVRTSLQMARAPRANSGLVDLRELAPRRPRK